MCKLKLHTSHQQNKQNSAGKAKKIRRTENGTGNGPRESSGAAGVKRTATRAIKISIHGPSAKTATGPGQI